VTIIIPNKSPGLRKSVLLIPEDLKPVISLSDDNLPNVIIVAISTAIGAAREIMDAELKIRN
tara:strand:- start:263 stop:448 length:186 start_codon:yes stop_codon:yes gene_type:complete